MKLNSKRLKIDIVRQPEFYYPIIIGFLSFISWQVWMGNEQKVQLIAHQEDIVRRLDNLETTTHDHLYNHPIRHNKKIALPILPLVKIDRRLDYRIKIVDE